MRLGDINHYSAPDLFEKFNPENNGEIIYDRCYGQVLLSVFNTLGQLVSTLVNGEEEAGNHEVKFDGIGLASGLYIYRLKAEGFVSSRKMLVLK